MEIPFVDLKPQYKVIKSEVLSSITAVMERGDFILGREVEIFEKEFADLHETKYGIGVASGTDALSLSLLACNIGPGDEVIIPANTFVAASLAICLVGARPVLVDVDPETCNIDLNKVEKAITEKTRALMPVHLYGQPTDIAGLLDITKNHNLIMIEDACQAHGARYEGRRVGGFGKVGCFSFYPAKNLGAYGDGGIVITNDERIAREIKILRNYGQAEKHHHVRRGLNSRLDTLQAALLRVKLGYLDSWNEKRRKLAERYDTLLKDVEGLRLFPRKSNIEHVFHLYVVRVKERAKLKAVLEDSGVSSQVHYPIPIHLQKSYEFLGYKKGDFPVTEKLSDEILSLPLYPELHVEQIEYIGGVIKEFYAVSYSSALSTSISRNGSLS